MSAPHRRLNRSSHAMLQRWLTSLALAFSYSVIRSCVEKILLATALLDSCFARFSCMFCVGHTHLVPWECCLKITAAKRLPEYSWEIPCPSFSVLKDVVKVKRGPGPAKFFESRRAEPRKGPMARSFDRSMGRRISNGAVRLNPDESDEKERKKENSSPISDVRKGPPRPPDRESEKVTVKCVTECECKIKEGWRKAKGAMQ